MSLANNHSQDFGAFGLAATKRALTQEGVKFSSKDGEVAEFLVKGVRVGVIALTYGPPPRSIVFPAEALREISSLARKYDILVVSIHGGAEGGGAQNVRNQTEIFLGENRGNLVKFSRDAIDRGADLILGHGPHVPRALEVYKGRLIAYSLGNFCTYKTMNLAGAGGYAPVLWAELDGKGEFVRGRVHSFIQLPPGGVKKDPREQAFRLMRALSQVDFPESAPQFTSGGTILPGKGR
jgi:poly-gamma-glutamate capsule biosynthesis protein CapA/YwtB (metallophosphatase superfamily)